MSENNKKKATQLILNDETLPVIEQISDQIPGGFFIYHADGDEELIYVNNGMLEIFGCADEEELRGLTGNSFKGIVHPDDLHRVEESIVSQIAVNTNDRDYVEYRIIRKDGSIRYIEDYGHFVHTEQYGDIYYVFINDATEKHIAEEFEKQEHLNRFKMDFLFNISHDIRTPMNSIMGFTALAKSHIHDPDILEDYLGKVDMSNRHMMSLIDDILEMSSIESGKVSLKTEPCDLSVQLDGVITMLRPSLDEKHQTLTTHTELPDKEVYADTARFCRIMSNVIGNAVKFTPDGGHITVSARVKEVPGMGYSRYEFTVTDDGIGMSEEFLTRIFRAFEREETSTKTGYPGAGLGLSITKSLLDMMGGSISVKSRKGEGSSFLISIPLKNADFADIREKPDLTPEELAEVPTEGVRILLVEDIEINRLLAETVLRKFGFTVESVVDGCDAVDAVRSHPEGYYSLVLMDIQMPVMNGYEAARAIRALRRPDTASLPIIALSANAGMEDKRMSIESGMNTHIAKPFDTDNLVNTIKKYIKQ